MSGNNGGHKRSSSTFFSLARLSALVVRTFFREIVIEGRDHLPEGTPIIFAANHPNALLDPLLLQLFSPEYHVRFVAKSTLFKVPVFGALLRKARAIPVVRRMDAEGTVDYTEFFSACLDALKNGDSIGIFPEGRSLPQPFLAPLRTGAARLFFMARESGVKPALIPVGLNYERGAVFRSSVLISVAPPLDTARYENLYVTDPIRAARELTERLTDRLEESVFQAENFRDRELMILLERIYRQEQKDGWSDRVARLKQFEAGLARLRNKFPAQIQRVRNLLSRYQRLCNLYGLEPGQKREAPITWNVIAIAGMFIAGLGWLFNWIPYKVCALLVRWAKKDESEAATFKVIYSLFLFPIAYVFEAILMHRLFGGRATLAFAVGILPLTFFTLRFFEWREEVSRDRPKLPLLLSGGWGRASNQLSRLCARIVRDVDSLASMLERTGGS